MDSRRRIGRAGKHEAGLPGARGVERLIPVSGAEDSPGRGPQWGESL